jgi:WD40 repeat protein
MHWNDIRGNPLTVYSLFAFAPKSTIFYTAYAKSMDFPHPVVTMGLEDDWPSHILIKAHSIEITHLSRCGNWFVTGGDDGSQPVYGIWNVKLGDGEIHIHPCGALHCRIMDIRTYDHETELRLQTFCRCGTLCRFDMSSSPPILNEEMKLEYGSNDNWPLWSEDGKIAVRTQQKENGSRLHLLWRNVDQDLYHKIFEETYAGYRSCTFSPGKGDKLAYYRNDLLEMRSSLTGELLFTKGPYLHVLRDSFNFPFAPDGQSIILPDSREINCISTENGEPKWNITSKLNVLNDYIIQFVSDGSMILIAQGDIRVISAIDGSLLYRSDSLTNKVDFLSLDPNNEWVIIILKDEDVLLWNLLQDSGTALHSRAVLASGSRNFSWRHSALIEDLDNKISFSYIDLTSPPLPQSDSYISHVLLSPNGLNLAIVFREGTIELWDTTQGIRKISIKFAFNYRSEDIKLEFTKDSSTLLAWRARSQEMQLIHISDLSIKPLNIRDSMAVAFLSASENILIIASNGTIGIYSFDGILLHIPAWISVSPSILCHSLTISSNDQWVAMICRGSLIVKELCSDIREFEWPGACVGMTFTADSSYILVVENFSRDVIVSHLRICDMTVQRRWAMVGHGLEITPRYDISALEIKEPILSDWPFDSLVSSFDLSDGKRIIPPILRHRRYIVQFCKYRIMHTRATEYDPWITDWGSTNHLAVWCEDCSRVLAVNISLLIRHA